MKAIAGAVAVQLIGLVLIIAFASIFNTDDDNLNTRINCTSHSINHNGDTYYESGSNCK